MGHLFSGITPLDSINVYPYPAPKPKPKPMTPSDMLCAGSLVNMTDSSHIPRRPSRRFAVIPVHA